MMRLGKNKTQKELKDMIDKTKNKDASQSSNSDQEDDVKIDKIGTKSPWKKEKKRSFLQKRKDAKDNFIERMAKYKQ